MKLDVKNSRGLEAITSDQWHVIRAHMANRGAKRPYVRTVESEHADCETCTRTAKELRRRIAAESADVPEGERDEIVVRRPNFKTLKVATSLRKRRAARAVAANRLRKPAKARKSVRPVKKAAPPKPE